MKIPKLLQAALVLAVVYFGFILVFDVILDAGGATPGQSWPMGIGIPVPRGMLTSNWQARVRGPGGFKTGYGRSTAGFRRLEEPPFPGACP